LMFNVPLLPGIPNFEYTWFLSFLFSKNIMESYMLLLYSVAHIIIQTLRMSYISKS
jgi:hypothetical protein